ncbi:unnamed protein product, partial [Pleuronectes platessa]
PLSKAPYSPNICSPSASALESAPVGLAQRGLSSRTDGPVSVVQLRSLAPEIRPVVDLHDGSCPGTVSRSAGTDRSCPGVRGRDSRGTASALALSQRRGQELVREEEEEEEAYGKTYSEEEAEDDARRTRGGKEMEEEKEEGVKKRGRDEEKRRRGKMKEKEERDG